MTNLVVREEEQHLTMAKVRLELDQQISTAKAYPRDLERFYANVERMVLKDEETAASCFYQLPRSGNDKAVEGRSIRFAEIVSCNYGNLQCGSRISGIEGGYIKAEAVVWDLENNIKIVREVMRPITSRDGRRYNDQMIATTGNAACSIALRNAIFTIIPQSATDEIYKKAKDLTLAGMSQKGKLEAMIAAFGELKNTEGINVTKQHLCKYMGVKDLKEIDTEDMLHLRGIYNAIKEGSCSADVIINPDALEKRSEAIKRNMEKVNEER